MNSRKRHTHLIPNSQVNISFSVRASLRSRSWCLIVSKCLLGIVKSNQWMAVLFLVGHLSHRCLSWSTPINNWASPLFAPWTKQHGGKNSNYTLYNIFTHLLLLLAPLGVPEISVCHCRDPQPFLQFLLLVDHLECNKLCCQVSILLMPDIRKVQIFYLFWLGAKIFPSPVTEDLVIQACNSNIPREIVGV